MRYFLICEDTDTLTGLRLAGIEGKLCQTRREIEQSIDRAQADPQIAILLISEYCASLTPTRINELKLSAHRPLVVVIPGSKGTTRPSDSITRLVREAIGIRI